MKINFSKKKTKKKTINYSKPHLTTNIQLKFSFPKLLLKISHLLFFRPYLSDF